MEESSARKILGLKPRENPTPRLAKLRANIKRRETFIENAPSPETRQRLKKELDEYREALALIADIAQTGQKRRHLGFCCCLAVIAITSCIAWWKYEEHLRHQSKLEQARAEQYQERRQELRQQAVRARLEQGDDALARRQWSKATDAYRAALKLDPDSSPARQGLESVDAGRLEEKNQKIFYRLGESQAALEAGEWDKATQLVLSVLKENPGHEEAAKKLETIKAKRRQHKLALMVQSIEKHLEDGDLKLAQQACALLQKEEPAHPELPSYQKRVQNALAELQARQRQARSLLDQARQMDQGQYSAEAVRLLEQAIQLDPDNPEIQGLHKKMNLYTRTIRVPADAATINDAIALARPKDRVEIAPGIYREAVILDKPVKLEGVVVQQAGNAGKSGKQSDRSPIRKGSGKKKNEESVVDRVILQLPAGEAPMLTIRSTADGSHIRGISFQHAGFDYDDDRSSAVIVQGASVTISECTIKQAAGHGLAVIDGGKARILGCSFTHCGWDGVSVYGKSDQRASYAELFNCISQDNLQHGVEFWKGGYGKMENCRVLGNGLCGVLAMTPAAEVSVQRSLCSRNRGAGILLSDQVRGKLVANRCDHNLLSGIVARGQGTEVHLINNVCNGNQELGILIHRGVKRSAFSGNQASGNKHRQVWLDAALTP